MGGRLAEQAGSRPSARVRLRPLPQVEQRGALLSARGPPGTGLLGGLEQLDQVAGGVGDKYLASAGAGDRVAAERHPGSAEPIDLDVQILDDEVDAVATGCGRIGGGRAGTGAGGSGQ